MKKQHFFKAGNGRPQARLDRTKNAIVDCKGQDYHVNLWLGDYQRRIGQQISPWSCVPTAYEIANHLWYGNKGKRQEDLPDRYPWLNNGQTLLHLMPFSKISHRRARSHMGVKLAKTLRGKQVTFKNLTKDRGLDHYAWVLFFTKFGLPGKKPTEGHSHACVPLVMDGYVDIYMPAFGRNKKIKKSLVRRYKSWDDIMAIKPTTALLITPR